MGSYQNPVGEPDPYDKYRVEPIEERKTKGNGSNSPNQRPPDEKKKFFAYILSLFQKAIDVFLEKNRNQQISSQDPTINLQAFQTSLEILKTEDRSQDVKFLNTLSTQWTALMESSLQINQEAVELKFKLLAKKILHYPQNLPHTFGYYLTEFAGQKWVPFPYMELIQKIHKEHEIAKELSALTEWTDLITEIIELMNS